MKEFIESLVKQLVDDPSTIKVTEENVEDKVVIKVSVDKKEVGKVIGKQGRTAQALRTLLTAVAAKQKIKARLEIID